jgi:hypothetical protein
MSIISINATRGNRSTSCTVRTGFPARESRRSRPGRWSATDRSARRRTTHIRSFQLSSAACRPLDQRLALGPHLGRLRGKDFGHRTRLAELLRQSLAVATRQGCGVIFRSHPAIRARRNRIGSPDSLEVDQAAVDEQFGAGGVGGIGGEVEGCCCDFGSGASAAERNAGLGPLDKSVLLGRREPSRIGVMIGPGLMVLTRRDSVGSFARRCLLGTTSRNGSRVVGASDREQKPDRRPQAIGVMFINLAS